MTQITYNQLQSKILANIISQPSRLSEFRRLAGDKPEAFFFGVYGVVFKSIDYLAGNKNVNVENVFSTARDSKAGKNYLPSINEVEKEVKEVKIFEAARVENVAYFYNEATNKFTEKKITQNDPQFLAAASKLIYFFNTRGGSINVAKPIIESRKGMATEKQIDYLIRIRSKIGREKYTELKNTINIKVEDNYLLTKRQASNIIDYYNKHVKSFEFCADENFIKPNRNKIKQGINWLKLRNRRA